MMMTTKIAVAAIALLTTLPGVGFTPVADCDAPVAAPRDSTAARGGAAAFERLKALEGEWKAPMSNGTMVDVFRPIGFGSAVLHEEWLDGKQLTATVFYLVGGELHADHFCDLKNQLRYVADPSTDSSVVSFRMRGAQNLDAFPRHFHSTTWRFVDATHMTQDWHVVEKGKELRVVRLEFTRTK